MAESTLTSKFRQLFSHSAIYGLGSILQNALGFILIPLYTKYFSTDLYGIFSLVVLCGSIAGSIFYFGVHSALNRSFFDHPSGYERKKVVSTTFFILCTGAFLQIFCGILFMKNLSRVLFGNEIYAVPILLALMTSAFSFIANLFLILLRLEMKSKQVVILNVASFIGTALLIYFFIAYLKMGIWAPVTAQAISQFIVLIILGYLSRDYIIPAFSFPEMKFQLNWGLAIVLANFGTIILDWSDRFFINKFGTLDDVGIYSLGARIGSMITFVLVSPFMQIWSPMVMQHRNSDDAPAFYSIAITYYFMIGSIFCLILSIYSKELIYLFTARAEYHNAWVFVPWITFSLLIVGSTNLTDLGLQFEKKMYYTIWITWGCALLNVFLNFILIPRFGYLSVVYTKFVSYSISCLLSTAIAYKFYPMQFEIKRLGFIMITILLSLFVSFKIHLSVIWYETLIKTVIIMSVLILWYLFLISQSERNKLNRLLMGFRLAIAK